MNYLRGVGIFGSAFLGAHLMRGAAAAALLVWAIVHQTTHPWISLGAGVAALVALRGCPMCWSVGLVETLSQDTRPNAMRYFDQSWRFSLSPLKEHKTVLVTGATSVPGIIPEVESRASKGTSRATTLA